MKDNQDIAIQLSNGERGGFMRHLGHAYCHADAANRRRLEWAFPHVFTESSFQEPMSIIVTGNVVDGFEFIGPFSSPSAAVSYAEGECLHEWVIADLIRPTPD